MLTPIVLTLCALACVALALALALMASRKPFVGPPRPVRDENLEWYQTISQWRGTVSGGYGGRVPDVIRLGQMVEAQGAHIAALEARLAAIEERTGRSP
jgi:hypothetical protein